MTEASSDTARGGNSGVGAGAATSSDSGRAGTSGGASSGGRSTNGGGASSGGVAAGGASARGGQSAGGANAGGSDAATLAVAMGIGTNLGNTLDNTSQWETGWGQPRVTQRFINGLASQGIKTVRVPVAWDTYANNGTIAGEKLERVREIVAWIEAAGMYSIVNIHWDGGWIFNEQNSNKFRLTDDVKTKFASYWTQIAKGFSAVGPKLVFEGLNEEARFYQDGDSTKAPNYTSLNQINQLFVTTVRAQGGNNATRPLLIAGFETDIDRTCVDAFTVPQDPAGPGKLLLSIHFYTPFPFCLLDTVESWASPVTTWGTSAEQKALQDQFLKLARFSRDKKIPIILGEFAVTRGEKYPRQSASRIAWMQAVMKASLAHGMVPVLWDTGSDIDRADGSFSADFRTVVDGLP